MCILILLLSEDQLFCSSSALLCNSSHEMFVTLNQAHANLCAPTFLKFHKSVCLRVCVCVCMCVCVYCIIKDIGGKKVWWIRTIENLAKNTLMDWNSFAIRFNVPCFKSPIDGYAQSCTELRLLNAVENLSPTA